MDIQGKTVVVTGAGRGIGRSIALAFAAAGARLALASRTVSELEETAGLVTDAGALALIAPTDIAEPDQVEAMVQKTEDELGPVEVLVNNAARLTAAGPTWEVDRDRWRLDVLVNLYGTFLCCRAALRRMVPRRRGYIINLVGGGVDSAQPYTAAYGSSKAGVMGFTDSLAIEVKEHGVKVFALDPGPVVTAMTLPLMEKNPRVREFFEQSAGQPETAAQLAVALVGGKVDALSGRYFQAGDDVDRLAAEVDRILKENLRKLRIRR